ncbi:protein kinase [Sorangium sp. So ce1036]|uniref:serine/threonine-protein kinase n=1 Tax=Sorangium sp. So ce1036 TaxID=3133328 RepID=UPI003F0B8FBB
MAPGQRADAEPAPRAAEGSPGTQELVAGRYAVETRIGAGGLGVVQLASDLRSGRRVALKRVDPRIAENKLAVERLLRGARAARSLSGRYVARILDVGSHRGAPFVASEYVEGSDLTSYLRRRGPLRIREAVKYLLQICEAVAEAHAIGILHRDIKPENLILGFGADGAPSVKVLDFGVSAVACGLESEGPNAASGAMRSSLLYMAPEQMRSAGGIDERADLWSIGAVGYALVCGASPFDAETEIDVCSRVLNEPPARVPPHIQLGELEAVLVRCLEKDPDGRFPDVAKLAFALARFGGDAAEAAAERVWEVLRADETVRMAKPNPDPAADEWAPDTLADLPRMSPDELLPADLESTAKWDASTISGSHSEITLVSHAGASWDGGETLRTSRPPPEVVTVSPPELPSERAAMQPGPRATGEEPGSPAAEDDPAAPRDRASTHRVSAPAAPRVTPPPEARGPARTERLTRVRRAPSLWAPRLAVGLAAAGLLAGIGGVWLVQAGNLDAGEPALPATKGVADRALHAARSLAATVRPSEPAPPPPEEPVQAPPAAAAGSAGALPDAMAPGGFPHEVRPPPGLAEAERERLRREIIERERQWRERLEHARRQRDELARALKQREEAERAQQQPEQDAGAQGKPDESADAQDPYEESAGTQGKPGASGGAQGKPEASGGAQSKPQASGGAQRPKAE